MESLMALFCVFLYLHCTLSRITARLLMAFIRIKPEFDLIDSKNDARYLQHHYPARMATAIKGPGD